MTLEVVLEHLQALSDPRTKAFNTKHGVGENQYGAKLGDIRKLAKKIKSNHALALALWKTENFDARMLATLVIKPEELSAGELDDMVRGTKNERVADWLNSYVVKEHPENEKLRLQWMEDNHAMAARAGWNLTKQRIVRSPEMIDIPAILDCLEHEMATTAPEAQWTMNFCLVEIGINLPEYRERALAIGEKLGIYKDYPTAKGCTSPYAPTWINEMVSRQAS